MEGSWKRCRIKGSGERGGHTDLCLPFPHPDFLPSFLKKGFVAFSQTHDLKPETISETGLIFLLWLKFLMGLDLLLPARPPKLPQTMLPAGNKA